MINTERLCIGCMNDNGGERVCPICGYDCATLNPNECLPARFVINHRYFVGKVLSVNGEGITYIGWDNGNNAIVNIKEYFPKGAAHRNPDKTVSIVKGGEYLFNEGLLEFAEINRSIMNSELPSLVPVTDVFEENGTFYAIIRSIQGITLGEFLEKNGGILKWEQARALFLPLIDTIKGMNDIGIIHGGISADTVIVGRDGKLRISDYSIKNLRNEGSGIEAELYVGYAAAEQYGFENLHIDTYTDVYGLCATLFRVLIGAVPPIASDRMNNDAMTIPARFAEELPRHVLASLANGLQVMPKDRTKDIDTFKNELVYGELPKAAPAKGSSKDGEVVRKKKKKRGSSAKYAVLSAVCTVLVFLCIGAVLVFGVFKDDIFKKDDGNLNSKTEVDAPVVDQIGDIDSGAELVSKLYEVPDFRAKYYSDIVESSDYEMFEFQISGKEYSNQYPKGTVCKQSVEKGTGVVRDTKISVTISLGPKEIKIANVKGLDEDAAKLELLKQGFLYDNIIVEEKYDSDREPGVVIDQEPKYNTSVNTEIAVRIYINSYKGEDESQEGVLY